MGNKCFLQTSCRQRWTHVCSWYLITIDQTFINCLYYIHTLHCTALQVSSWSPMNSLLLHIGLILWAQNFYVLKIHLNLFEISNQVLNFKNLIQIKFFLFSMKIYFKHWHSEVINLNKRPWHHNTESILERNFEILKYFFLWQNKTFQISKLDMGFQMN